MNPASRQDVQNAVDVLRSRVMERMVTKQELAVLCDTIKNLTLLEQQSQQMLKQADYNRSQMTRRIVSLETRIANFENEVRLLTAAVNRGGEQQKPQQQITMPVQNQPDQQALEEAAAYAYRPAVQ